MEDLKYSTDLNIPHSPKPRLVILGGGFGGINLLKKVSDHFQVVMLDRYNYHTFQPLLYQVATAGLEPDAIAGPLRKIINRKEDIFFRMVSAESVSTDLKVVYTSAGELHYDYLVVATGARVNFFGNESIAKHAFPLKQLNHALDLRSHIFQQFEKLALLQKNQDKSKIINFVVVGAGPTGVEVCGALAELQKHVLPNDYPDLDLSKIKIYLIEGLDRILPGMSVQAGKKAKKYLEEMGIHIKLNTLTTYYNGERVELDNGEFIRTETLIWAAGVKGNLIDGFHENSLRNGKLRINKHHQLLGNGSKDGVFEDVFAIGDVGMMESKQYPDGLPGVAQTAIQQGNHLAQNLKLMLQNKPLKKFSYLNKGVMATIGRNKAVADLPPNIKLSGFLGWFTWMVVHLLFLVGFRNKIVALTNWVWNYFSYDRSVRIILQPSKMNDDRLSYKMKEEMHEHAY